MKTVFVKLGNIFEVQKLVGILERYQGDFNMICGRCMVDAKSILGILSLDISRVLQLDIYEEDENVIKELSPYLQRGDYYEEKMAV